MVRMKFLLGIVISLSLSVAGVVILAYFCTPIEKSEVWFDEFFSVKANEYGVKTFFYYSGDDNILSFSVTNGTIKSCEPLTEALLLEWQAGQYEPNWVEADHARRARASRYGNTIDAIFVEATGLKSKFREKFESLPTGAIGLYTYNQRLIHGLKQFMCGARKFALQHITRGDIAALTPEAVRTSRINSIMDVDKEEVERILR